MSIYRAVEAALYEANAVDDFEGGAERILQLIGSPEALMDLTGGSVLVTDRAGPSAYLHSNGFLKVEYMRAGPLGFRVRGHFWNPAWGSASQNPHNHAFDFRSRVVIGAFQHRHFSRASEGRGVFHHGYRYSRAMRAGVDRYVLEQADPAWLQQSEIHTMAPDEEYLMLGHQLHTLDPTGAGFGATVVVSRPYNDRPWSEVFSLNGELHRASRNSKLLDAKRMVECVTSVLDR